MSIRWPCPLTRGQPPLEIVTRSPILCLNNWTVLNPSDNTKELIQYWFEAGAPSATLAQHQASVGSTSRVCCEDRNLIATWPEGTQSWSAVKFNELDHSRDSSLSTLLVIFNCILTIFMDIHIVTSIACFSPYSARIDVIRQNLTSVDVRIWRLKSIPALWM